MQLFPPVLIICYLKSSHRYSLCSNKQTFSVLSKSHFASLQYLSLVFFVILLQWHGTHVWSAHSDTAVWCGRQCSQLKAINQMSAGLLFSLALKYIVSDVTTLISPRAYAPMLPKRVLTRRGHRTQDVWACPVASGYWKWLSRVLWVVGLLPQWVRLLMCVLQMFTRNLGSAETKQSQSPVKRLGPLCFSSHS